MKKYLIISMLLIMLLNIFMNVSAVFAGYWIKPGDYWHYNFSNNYGDFAHSGLHEIDGKTYYFNSAGQMQTGKVRIGNEYYIFGDDGAFVEKYKAEVKKNNGNMIFAGIFIFGFIILFIFYCMWYYSRPKYKPTNQAAYDAARVAGGIAMIAGTQYLLDKELKKSQERHSETLKKSSESMKRVTDFIGSLDQMYK